MAGKLSFDSLTLAITCVHGLQTEHAPYRPLASIPKAHMILQELIDLFPLKAVDTLELS